MLAPFRMLLPPLPRKLTFHPTPLSLRQAHVDSQAPVVVLDGDMTFADFWPRFDDACAGRTLPTAEARRLVRALLRRGAVPQWQAQAEDAWSVMRVHDALGELRMAGVTARALEASPSEQVSAWAALLAAYEEALQTHGWVDAAERQRLAVLQVAQGAMPPGLREVERVEVLCGTELLGARLDVLRAFAARGVPVRVHMPWDEERPHAFAWTEALLHALETLGHPNMTTVFSPRHGRGALRAVVSSLYAALPDGTAQNTPAPPEDAAPPVAVRKAPLGWEHAESVAAQVAAWLGASIAARDIAVVVPSQPMAADVVRALHGAGIGCAHNVQPSLMQSRIARLYIEGLRMQGGQARGAWWAQWWDLCGTPVHTAEGTWTPSRVSRALRRAGLATERLWSPCAEASMPQLAQALPQACAEVIFAAMAEASAPLAALPEAGTLAQLAPGLLRWVQLLARAWQPGGRAAQPSAGLTPDAAADTTADASLAAAVAADGEAATLLQQCVLDAVGGDAASEDMWTRAALADWLEAICGERTFAAVPSAPQGVQLLRPDDAVGGRFRCVLFAGADMESFPRPLPTNAFLPEGARVEINRLLGPRLRQYAPMLGRGALPAMARDQWLWLEVANAASEQWVVTLQESHGEAMLGPSELVDALLRASGVPITTLAPSRCIDAVVPKPWTPRLWAARPQALHALMQATDAGVPKRLSGRFGRGAERAHKAHVPGAIAARMRRHFEQTVHSASRMDALGMCSFRYVAAAVWGLGTDEDTVLGATPRELGSAAHAALHRVYQAIMRQGGLREARLLPERALATAASVVASEAQDILAETRVHALLQPALLADTTAAAVAQLTRDLAAQTPHEPVALEYAFDDRYPDGPDALDITHPSGGMQVRVRGSIDRVDVTDEAIWVLDYKRTVRQRDPDRHFQLALYAAIALRDLLPEARQVRVGWAGLQSAKIHWAEDMPEAPEALMTHLRERLFARIDPVAEGRFSPDPDDPTTCERCDFRRLCRLDDRAAPPASTSPSSEVPHG